MRWDLWLSKNRFSQWEVLDEKLVFLKIKLLTVNLNKDFFKKKSFINHEQSIPPQCAKVLKSSQSCFEGFPKPSECLSLHIDSAGSPKTYCLRFTHACADNWRHFLKRLCESSRGQSCFNMSKIVCSFHRCVLHRRPFWMFYRITFPSN